MAVVSDGGLERGDHRKLCERPADLVEASLLGIGVAALPRLVEPRDRRGVHVGRGADAAGAAAAHVAQQEGLRAGEDVEARPGERIEERLRVVPVAAAVFHPRGLLRIGLEQALDQAERDRYLGHGRNVIEIHAQPRLPHPLDDLGEAPEQAVVAHALVIERRQHQRAAAAQLDGVSGQPNGIGERTAARARHHPGGIEASAHQPLEQLDLLLHRQRVGFGVRSEHREADVLGEQPPALADEAIGVGREIGLERGDDRRKHAGDALGVVHGVRSLCARVCVARVRVCSTSTRVTRSRIPRRPLVQRLDLAQYPAAAGKTVLQRVGSVGPSSVSATACHFA